MCCITLREPSNVVRIFSWAISVLILKLASSPVISESYKLDFLGKRYLVSIDPQHFQIGELIELDQSLNASISQMNLLTFKCPLRVPDWNDIKWISLRHFLLPGLNEVRESVLHFNFISYKMVMKIKKVLV